MNSFKQVESLLYRSMDSDFSYFKKELNYLKKKKANTNISNQVIEEELRRIENKIKTSISKKEWRRRNRPKFSFDRNLPISSYKDEIITAIKNNQTIIISGKPGSGKSTQIPKLCLAAERGINGIIGCTQPRRIAAISVASRIAEELEEKTGKSVGYKIRFNDNTGTHPFIKIMTDGILLAETQGDPFLDSYDTIIIDEAHERSLNIDLIIAILRTILIKRKNLKLIITSATINTEKFSKVFNNAPVIEVSGRMFPVDVRYLPQTVEDGKNNIQSLTDQAVSAVYSIFEESKSGDILIFMPTEQDIHESCSLLKKQNNNMFEVYPLFARLPTSQQKNIFKKISKRKIIVSTNIAETSLTIPNIKYVIDTGLARISQYSPSTRIVSLPVKAISKSSADQRTGRCGRVEDGICIRLFDKEDYETRPSFMPPEILRTNLAGVILKLMTLKLGDISKFPFVDKPKQQNINDGYNTLLELGAIAKNEQNRFVLTETGKKMAKLPIDPRLSRMLIEAEEEKCLHEILIIASMLSVQNPMERPVNKEMEADMKHKTFRHNSSDFITLLNIWNGFHENLATKKSHNKMRKYCKNNFLSHKRIREIRDVHTQLTMICKEHGIIDNKKNKTVPKEIKESDSLYSRIHKSIISGFLSNIALGQEDNVYTMSNGREVLVFPGSSLYKKAKKWLICAEIIQTSRLYLRTAANINVDWLEEIGRSQCKYSYHDPYWDKDRMEVMAYERASLYGLTIVQNRRVPYGPINPAEASMIFVRDALVEDTFTLIALEKIETVGNIDKLFQLQQIFPFLEYNVKLISRFLALEDRTRKRLIITRDDLFSFYYSRIKDVYDIKTLDIFLKMKRDDSFLRLKEKDVLLALPDNDELEDYPESVNIDNHIYNLDYCFNPDADKDGVTIKIPVSMAHTINPELLDWIVPGLYRGRLSALIKNLPKQYRKHLIPISDSVKRIVSEMPKGEKALITALGEFIYNSFKVDIPLKAWDIKRLPDHLIMRISVIDNNNREICASRDPEILKSDIIEQSGKEVFYQTKRSWEKKDITRWNFDDLPDSIDIDSKNGGRWRFFLGLSDENGKVSLRIFRDRERALISHKSGIALLLLMELSKQLKTVKEELTLPEHLKKTAINFGGMESIQNMLLQKIKNDYFYKDIRRKSDFYFYADSVRESVIEYGRELISYIINAFENCDQAKENLHRLETKNKTIKPILAFIKKIESELAFIVPNDFLIVYNEEELSYLEKYIKALSIRAQRGCINLAKDEQKEAEILFFYEALKDENNNLSPYASKKKKQALKEFFWFIQDYKVSIFAPELKTRTRVSRLRLEKRLEEIQKML